MLEVVVRATPPFYEQREDRDKWLEKCQAIDVVSSVHAVKQDAFRAFCEGNHPAWKRKFGESLRRLVGEHRIHADVVEPDPADGG
ncbi:MAG: hypothetical protein ABEN55_08755, partial [Bradymonadaceae bacterium]